MATLKVNKRDPLLKKYPSITPVGASLIRSHSGDIIQIPAGKWNTDPQSIENKNLIIKGQGVNKTELIVKRESTWLTLLSFGHITLENLTISVGGQANAFIMEDSFYGLFQTNNVVIRYTNEHSLIPYETYPTLVAKMPNAEEERKVVLSRTFVQYIELCSHQLNIDHSIIGDLTKPQSTIQTNGDGSPNTIKVSAITNTLIINEDKVPVQLTNIETNGCIESKGHMNIDTMTVLPYGDIALPKQSQPTDRFTSLREMIANLTIIKKLFKRKNETLREKLEWLNFETHGYVLTTDALDNYRSVISIRGDIGSQLESRTDDNYYGLGFINATNTDLILNEAFIPMFDTLSIATRGTITLDNANVMAHWDVNDIAISTKNQKDGITLDPQAVKDPNAGKPALEQLEELTGLTEAKKIVKQMVAVATINNERKRRGQPQTKDLSLHMVFLGNAGVGKTTVARLLAKALYENGVLPSDILVEVTSKDLIAGYVGQTRTQTHDVIESALGGVLFIDEAYSLDSGDKNNNFANEAVDQLIADMENYRDQLIVILAGYTDQMLHFLENGNPGLKSRFANHVTFTDYNISELETIMKYQLSHANMIPRNVASEKIAVAALKSLHKKTIEKTGNNAGNARFVRNYVQAIAMARDVRLSTEDIDKVDDEFLSQYTEDDVKVAHAKMVKTIKAFT